MSAFGFQNPGVSGAATDTSILRGASLRYPHPFFDVAQTYMPITVKHLFRWCHTYYMQNGLVNATINKMAQYPVTRINYKADSRAKEKLYEELFEEQMGLEAFNIEMNVDMYCFGNAIMSMHYPIVKYLICRGCKAKNPAHTVSYTFEGFRFKLNKCPRCGWSGEAAVEDRTIPSKNQLRLVRWDPMDVDVMHNQVTGESWYVLAVPLQTAMRIREGNPIFLSTTPQVFIDAVERNHRILLSPYNVFHMRRPNVVGKDMGIGMPLIVPVLKNLFQWQVMFKANEVVLNEHMTPLRIIHPASQGQADPASTLDLVSWQGTMRAELARFRQDPAYTPIVPMPIGFQYLGGQGRSLLVMQEMRQAAEMILAGMTVPVSFVFGGQTWTGSSVDARMLENQFLRNRSQLSKMNRFIVGSVSRFLGMDPVGVEFTSMKAADDAQRKSLLIQMAQLGKVSDATVLREFELNPADEAAKIESEQRSKSAIEAKQFIGNAENQGRGTVIQARYQAQAQAENAKRMQAAGLDPATGAPMMGGQPGDPNADPNAGGQPPQGQPPQGQAPTGQTQTIDEAQALKIAKSILKMPPEEQQPAIQELQQHLDAPSIKLIQQVMLELQNQDTMQPLPEQKPPRRSGKKTLV